MEPKSGRPPNRNDVAMTLDEIALEIGVTKMRASQILASALAKARIALAIRHGITVEELR